MKRLLQIGTLGLLLAGTGLPQAGTGVVMGRLRPGDGQTVSGIRVSAMAVPEAGVPATNATTLVSQAISDGTGGYRLENLPPGRYYVLAGLVDFPTYFPGVSALAEARVVDVGPGGTVRGIDFPLVAPPGVFVRGTLTIPAGTSPALNPRVALLGGSPPVNQTSVGADGAFEFQRVRPGTYRLSASAGPLEREVTVTVTDQDVSGIEAVVVQRFPITLNLAVEGGGPLPRFNLQFVPFRGGANAVNAPSTSTTLRTSLAAGDYRVTWSTLPQGYYLKSITAGPLDLLANPLKIATLPLPTVTVTLGVDSPPPWVQVSGRVTGLPASRTAGLQRLSLTGGSTGEVLSANINADGTFQLPMVLPGTYVARIATPSIAAPPTQIVVPTQDLTSVEIALPPLKEVRGSVLIQGLGQLAPRLNFVLNQQQPGSAMTVTASALPDGTFQVTLPEGEHPLNLNVPGYTVRSLTYGDRDLLREPLQITAADSAEFRVELETAATITRGGVVGGVLGGVISGARGGVVPPAEVPRVINGVLSPPPPPPPPPVFQQTPPQQTANSASSPILIYQVQPEYTDEARRARVSGTVVMRVKVAADGSVSDVVVTSGHPLLQDAAVEAVKKWRYQPFIRNGQAVPFDTAVTVSFSLR